MDLGFVHYRADAAHLRSLIPPELKVQEFDGTAWVGLVPFRMEQVAPRGWPTEALLPAFPELNLRTYVEHRGKAGVWFFSLDATSWAMVWGGRTFYGMPYHLAAMSLRQREDTFIFSSDRLDGEAKFAAHYRPTGPQMVVRPGSFEHWAAERYCLYSNIGNGVLRCIDVHHKPWPLYPAEIEITNNTVIAATGLSLKDTSPVCHFTPGVEVVAFPAENLT